MARLSPSLDALVDTIGKVARGAHQSQLDQQTLSALQRFGDFLLREGKRESTVQVYKSLVAKAAAQGADPTNPVMQSALRALARFSASQ
jgi:hypothetical protein